MSRAQTNYRLKIAIYFNATTQISVTVILRREKIISASLASIILSSAYNIIDFFIGLISIIALMCIYVQLKSMFQADVFESKKNSGTANSLNTL